MRRINIDRVKPGMVLGKTIYGYNYEMLLNKGVIITENHIIQLKNKGFFKIYIDDEETADVVIEDPISDKIRIMATKDVLKTYTVTQASLEHIEADTTEAIIKSINTPKIKRPFQESPAFKQLCIDLNAFVDELINQDILSGLNSIKSFDNYTYEHSIDTAVIALIIGKRLSLNSEKLRQIAMGEFLHDIEKIEAASAHIAYQHHERQDGKGYPRGLRGNNKLDRGIITYSDHGKMIMIAEIAAIADFYDACISDRPYRKGLPPDLVYDMFTDRGEARFNRELIDRFLNSIPKYPVGFDVRIKTGKHKDFVGVVLSLNLYELSKPKVKILYDAKTNNIAPA